MILFVVLLWLTLGSAQRPPCRTIPTKGGSLIPTPCVFPFRHQGKIYRSCTKDFDPDGKLWCSTQVNPSGHHVTGSGKWGHCSASCFTSVTRPPTRPTTSRTNRRTTPSSSSFNKPSRNIQRPPVKLTSQINPTYHCSTVSGPKPGLSCAIPFIADGLQHNECTFEGVFDDLPWCSTKVNSRRQHLQGNWGHCECITSEGCPSATFLGLVKSNDDGTELPVNNDDNFRCGVSRIDEKVEQIRGGAAAGLGEFPFAALLIYYNSPGTQSEPKFQCGGSLINRRYVLTAAHCITDKGPRQVRLGDYDVAKQCDCKNEPEKICAPIPQTIDVSKVIPHEGYDPDSGYVNDIALVRLKSLAMLNTGTGVVCLPVESLDPSHSFVRGTGSDLSGQKATVIGWGKVDDSSIQNFQRTGISNAILQSVEVTIKSEPVCRRAWQNLAFQPSQICAGDVGKDSCNGDSGGPILMKSGSVWYQVGLVSYGANDCGNGLPGVYTRVAYYLDWIRANLKK